MQRKEILRRTHYFPGGRICVWCGLISTIILLECLDPNYELNPEARAEIRGQWKLDVGQNTHGYAFHESDAAMFLELPTKQLDGLLQSLRYLYQRLVSSRAHFTTEVAKWLN
jgi:hypothetical protein